MKESQEIPTGDHLEVLSLLLDGGPQTRVQLAEITGWSRNTVAARLNELIEQGWVACEESEGRRGRPSTLYSLNRRNGFFFVISFGPSRLHAAITDLAGTPLATEKLEFNIEQGPESATRVAVGLMEQLSQQAGVVPGSVRAAAVAVPSPLDHSTRRPINPSGMPGWGHFDVADGFAAALGVPTSVDNDANAMADGARRLLDIAADDLLFVIIDNGVGMGIVSHGEVLRGARGLAGEIAHLPVPKVADRTCTCGNRGCVGLIASGNAILKELSDVGLKVQTMSDVAVLCEQGDSTALRALREAGRALGEVLVGVTATVSPSVIVIGGEAAIGDHLASGVREVIFARSVPAFVAQLRIVSTLLHEECALRGAALRATQVLFAPPNSPVMTMSTAGTTNQALQGFPT